MRTTGSEVQAIEPKVWQEMTQGQLDWAYDQANHAPNRVEVLEQIAHQSALSREQVPKPLRLSYGPSPIEMLDWYVSEQANAPLVFFVHGGAWKSGTALANALQAHWLRALGCHVVIPDFDAVTSVDGDLAHLARQVQSALLYTYNNCSKHHADPQRIIVLGHSSGAHLSACMVTRDWVSVGLERAPISALLCCSGMYDLEPVSLSARSQYVRFTPELVQDLSPQRQTQQFQMPVVLLCGENESPEFIRQFHEFDDALRLNNAMVSSHVVQGVNHFEILQTLFDPESIHSKALKTLIEEPLEHLPVNI